jgi:cell shape-determining protein MreC
MYSSRTPFRSRLASPAGTLLAGLAAAVVLLLLPTGWTAAIKSVTAEVLRPGQLAALALREHADRAATAVASHFQSAGELADLQEELARLGEENRRLANALTAASAPSAPPDNAADRLLGVRAIPARVLGHQARVFLAQAGLLDVGSTSGVRPESFVVEMPPLVDRGADHNVEPGQWVASAGCVWGKILEVGRRTSTVRPITEPGYRDLVALTGPDGKGRGPQGILEGTGEPLARVRLVEVTEPVAAGDLVWTASGKGLLPKPLLCGRVTRVERAAGAAHWDIWMQPTVNAAEVERAVVLQAEVVESGNRKAEGGAGGHKQTEPRP